MAVGDVTIIPSGGLNIAGKVTCVCGTTTTMYVGTDKGEVKSITTSGVMADLATKVKVPGKIVAIAYSGSIVIITADGKVYTVATNGASLTMIVNLNMGVAGAYYYSNYLYVILDGSQQEKSNVLKIALT